MIGLEPTLAEHMAKIVAVFAEVRRVLRDDGVCWVNYGDAYSNGGKACTGDTRKGFNARYFGTEETHGSKQDGHGEARKTPGVDSGLAPKQRLLMPARVALALQDDGWWVRSEIVWAKGVSFCPTYSGSCMPSSVRDRPTDSHEMVYLLTKRARYFYDSDAVREEAVFKASRRPESVQAEPKRNTLPAMANSAPGGGDPSTGRNLRTVWCINPRGYKEAHFATFPPALVEPCVKAGTSERGACSECGAPWRRVVETSGEWRAQHERDAKHTGDGTPYRRNPGGGIAGPNTSRTTRTTGWEPTCDHKGAPTRPCVVLDPFSGSGTTGAVAVRLGRSYVGIELNPEYAKLSRKRIGRAAADIGHGGTVTADEDERAAQLGLWV